MSEKANETVESNKMEANMSRQNMEDERIQSRRNEDEESIDEQHNKSGEVEEEDLMETEYNIRQNEENEEDWTVVKRSKAKRWKPNSVDVCISSKNQLPKQFALAKLFHRLNIGGITRVKYINAFKVLLAFEDIAFSEKFAACPEIQEQGWRIQNSWEVNISYGIVKNMEIGISEDDLMENIRTSNNCEIVAIKRLNKRNPASPGWIDSETIRLSFKGNSLPEYVYLFNTRVKVEAYIFPVTQCSNCWRFGHSAKYCPSTKIFCPKCGKHHPNCETNSFKCINCKGNHMALAKTCPIYLKERRIREIMSEFNCTYRKASLMYVPPFSPAVHRETSENITYTMQNTTFPTDPRNKNSYASVVSKITQDENNTLFSNEHLKSSKKNKRKSKKRKQRFSSDQSIHDWDASSQASETSSDTSGPIKEGNQDAGQGGSCHPHIPSTSTTQDPKPQTTLHDTSKYFRRDRTRKTHSGSDISIMEVLYKLKEVVFCSNKPWSVKFKLCINYLLDWTINVMLINLPDASTFKKWFTLIFDSING